MDSSDEEDVASSPFSDELLADPVPVRFNTPNFDHYNGDGDLEEHIIRFESAFAVWDLSSGFKVRLLFSKSRGPVLSWFTHLPLGSIKSYPRFMKMFITRFTNSKRRMKDPQVLFDVQQKEGECLHAYIRRFLNASLKVEDLDEMTSGHAFSHGLLGGPLRQKFRVHRDFSFKKMIEVATAYADAESDQEAAPRAKKVAKQEPATRDDQKQVQAQPAIQQHQAAMRQGYHYQASYQGRNHTWQRKNGGQEVAYITITPLLTLP